MRCPRASVWIASLLACAACRTTAPFSDRQLATLLAAAPATPPARLWLEGGRLVAAAVPVGPGSLPADVRRMVAAIAPDGARVFEGREWGPRGDGYRIDVRYDGDEGPEHERSLLVTADGRVLERSHTVPIPDVPQHVLASAMQVAARIDEARIVSGPEREEYWTLAVHDRSGREFVVEVTLDGRVLRSRRRVEARVEG